MSGSKRPFSISDLYQIKIAYMPRISPDGSQLAYVVKTWDREQDMVKDQIRIHNFDTGEGSCLPGNDSKNFPRWSPDGEKIAFILETGGRNNLWIADLKHNRTWSVQTGLEVESAPVWSPDGQKIAFTGLAIHGEDNYCFNFKSLRNKIQENSYRSDATVITKFYHKYDGMGFFGNKNRQIFVVDSSNRGGVAPLQLTEGNMNHYAPAWSPDGRYLVCVVKRDRVIERGVFKYDLKCLELQTGQQKLLLNSNGPIKSPVWSPDGKCIAYIGHQNHAGRVTNDNVWLLPFNLANNYPLTREEIINLTAGLDRPVGMTIDSDLYDIDQKILPIFWNKDGTKIYFIAGDRGDGYVYSVETGLKSLSMKGIINGEYDHVIKVEAGETGRVVTSFNIDRDERLIYSSCSPVCPDELFIKGKSANFQLTYHNEELTNEVKLFQPEQFVFKGTDDLEVSGWVLNKGRSQPLLVIIHGGPHLAYGNSFLMQSQVLAAAGYTVFFCNPRGSQSYGQEFASAVVQDWGGKDYQDILAGVDYLLTNGAANPENVGVTGWSYGGYMTNWLTARTNRFKAGVSGASVSNLYSFYGTSDIGYSFGEFETGGSTCFLKDRLINRSPISYVSAINTPLLLIHGEKDLRCPISQSEELFTALKRCGKEAVFVRYPDEYHIFEKPSHIIDKYLRIIYWFNYYLDFEGGELSSR